MTAEIMVVLVDEGDFEIGEIDLETAHREGLLHRAVSVFVFNETGEMLLQRRASTKRLFAGRWANTCCTHPLPGEGVVPAGMRRLREEMGLSIALQPIGRFVYRAEDNRSGYVEHELDHVLVGRSEMTPTINLDEADAYRWEPLDSLRRSASGAEYAPWLDLALRAFPDLSAP